MDIYTKARALKARRAQRRQSRKAVVRKKLTSFLVPMYYSHIQKEKLQHRVIRRLTKRRTGPNEAVTSFIGLFAHSNKHSSALFLLSVQSL